MANEIINASVVKLTTPAGYAGPGTSSSSSAGKVSTDRVDASVAQPAKQQASESVETTASEPKGLQEAVSQINEYVQDVKRDLSFSMDDKSGRTVITVTDSESGEVIRSIPSEEMLAIASYLKELRESTLDTNQAASGLLFSDSI